MENNLLNIVTEILKKDDRLIDFWGLNFIEKYN